MLRRELVLHATSQPPPPIVANRRARTTAETFSSTLEIHRRVADQNAREAIAFNDIHRDTSAYTFAP
ncbi:hypothetical protein RR46_04435 [Papilio xuthus]|uniref:Uncharacterized protein n=1 Tax=Papilio xuthus TaxID=66420 RepID=A0A194PM13_PAPXU|nr:hypothetical protein RR46_04435 [Papilio xuthus]